MVWSLVVLGLEFWWHWVGVCSFGGVGLGSGVLVVLGWGLKFWWSWVWGLGLHDPLWSWASNHASVPIRSEIESKVGAELQTNILKIIASSGRF